MKTISVGSLYSPDLKQALEKLLKVKGMSGSTVWKVIGLEQTRKENEAKVDTARTMLMSELCDKDTEGKPLITKGEKGEELVTFSKEAQAELNRRWSELVSQNVDIESPLSREELEPALSQVTPEELIPLMPLIG
jgi:hypothetical protein